jgi:uncharacterized protein (TIGR00297 family)
MDIMTFLTLNNKGLITAVLLGLLLLFLDNFKLIFLLFMLYFLSLSAIATFVGKEKKEKLGVYDKARGIPNVLSNSGGPVLMAFAFFIANATNHQYAAILFLIGFASSVAAITSDKFSSEIGVLDGMPISIISRKRVKKGVSGAVTMLGFGAGLFAALAVGLPFALVFLHGLMPSSTAVYYLYTSLSIAIGGFFGSFADSIFGYFEDQGSGNKFTSNLICGVFGGFFGILVFVLII